jgi:hypothetical protein
MLAERRSVMSRARAGFVVGGGLAGQKGRQYRRCHSNMGGFSMSPVSSVAIATPKYAPGFRKHVEMSPSAAEGEAVLHPSPPAATICWNVDHQVTTLRHHSNSDSLACDPLGSRVHARDRSVLPLSSFLATSEASCHDNSRREVNPPSSLLVTKQ